MKTEPSRLIPQSLTLQLLMEFQNM